MKATSDSRVKKLMKKWELKGERDRVLKRLVKSEFPELSRDAQKAIRQGMRMIKKFKRLPPDLRFDDSRTWRLGSRAKGASLGRGKRKVG